MVLIMNCEVKLKSSVEGELKINVMFCSVSKASFLTMFLWGCNGLGEMAGEGQTVVCSVIALTFCKQRLIRLICLHELFELTKRINRKVALVGPNDSCRNISSEAVVQSNYFVISCQTVTFCSLLLSCTTCPVALTCVSAAFCQVSVLVISFL